MFQGVFGLVGVLLGVTYAYLVIVATVHWGLQGFVLVTVAMTSSVLVWVFISEMLRHASLRLTAFFLTCCLLVILTGVVSGLGESRFLVQATHRWPWTFLVLGVAMGLSGLFTALFGWLRRRRTTEQELFFAVCCCGLLGYLGMVHVGSYSMPRDLLGLAVGFAVVAGVQKLRGRYALAPDWSRPATSLLVWGLVWSWVACTTLDALCERTPLAADPQRFATLGNDWPDLRIGLALSGGGYRAALVHAGVLSALEARRVRVSALSAVSGGAIIGAYYAAGGAPTLFVEAVGARKFNLMREMVHVHNVLRLLPGFTWLDRTRVQANLVDRRLLGGWRARHMSQPDQPRLMVGATDLQLGLLVGLLGEGVLFRDLPSLCDKQDCVEGFPAVLASTPWFIPRDQAQFPSDRERVADLVAASGAFPLVFPPRRIAVHQQLGSSAMAATPPKRTTRALVLSDGGLSDNSGVRLLLDARSLARPSQPRSMREDIFMRPQATAFMDTAWHVDMVLVSDGGRLLQDAERVGDWNPLRVMDVISESTGAPSAKQWARWQLTEHTLQALRTDHVPEAVVAKLATLDTNFLSFGSEAFFFTKVREVLTTEEVTLYRTKLLFHAQHSRGRPDPALLLLSPARFVFRQGAPLLRTRDSDDLHSPCRTLRPVGLPWGDLQEMEGQERQDLINLLPPAVARGMEQEGLAPSREPDHGSRLPAKAAGGDAASGWPMDAPRVGAASTGEHTLFHTVYEDVLQRLCDFQAASTLKDAYSPSEAESLFRLGQYMVILRWPEIKRALDRLACSKAGQTACQP